jgi:non-ribosomal peptide synthetase component F
LPPVRPYRDYISWQQSQDSAVAERFWRELLKGFKSPVELTVDRGSADVQGKDAEFQQERLQVSTNLIGGLQTLAKDHRLTLNTFLQGAWALLLSQYSGLRDIVYGAVVFGRPAEIRGVESMAGLFINTLPFRARIQAEDTPLPWLQALQQQLVQIQQYGCNSLVEISRWSEIPRGTPLFETIFGFDNAADASASDRLQQLSLENARLIDWNNYPLSVAVSPGAELSITLKYDRRRFTDVSIRQMLEDYERILERIVETPDSLLGDLVDNVSKRRRSEEERALESLSREKLRKIRRRTMSGAL